MQTPGVVVTTQVKMVTRRRRRVTRSPILPPISSDGIRNEIQETTTNRPKGQKMSTSQRIIMMKRGEFDEIDGWQHI